MEKRRLRDHEGKFRIDKQGNLEDNIKQLESELEVTSKGAPRIYERSEDIKHEATSHETAGNKGENQKEIQAEAYKQQSGKKHYSYHELHRHGKKHTSIYKNSKFYITLFAIAAFVIILTRAPIFQYMTPFRYDNDLPYVEVAFKYYNNILGKQTKQATVIKSGMEKVFVPIPMEQWVNLDIEKKKLVLEEYLYRNIPKTKTP
ncbi:MAG TPA: hypothetical protein PKN36_10890 [bacterium]|nr:hypothetical protein [bacterium]